MKQELLYIENKLHMNGSRAFKKILIKLQENNRSVGNSVKEGGNLKCFKKYMVWDLFPGFYKLQKIHSINFYSMK